MYLVTKLKKNYLNNLNILFFIKFIHIYKLEINFFNNFFLIYTFLTKKKNSKNLINYSINKNTFFKKKNKILNLYYTSFIQNKLFFFKKTKFLKKKKSLLSPFYYIFIFKNIKYNLFLNKYNSFWPLFNKLKLFLILKKKLNKLYYRKFKNLFLSFKKPNKISNKKKTNILLFLKNFKKKNLKKKIIIRKSRFKKFFKIKKIKKIKLFKKKKKTFSKFCNIHRRQIKIFWKSQIFFKNFFFKKTKWTIRKFKNKFKYWYKKNKYYMSPFLKKIELWRLLLKFNIFLTKNDAKNAIQQNLILVNGINPKFGFETEIQFNDIVSFYFNYFPILNYFRKKKILLKKKLKKLSYIYINNKRSQWRSLKKKKPKQLDTHFYQKFIISKNFEFDIYTSSFCFFNKNTNKSIFDYYTPRHNLDKLNIYKLNI